MKTLFRAAAPSATTQAQLGPLAELLGNWVGKGFNQVSLPGNPDPSLIFRLTLNATTETLTFDTAGGLIPDRGLGVNNDIFYLGLRYLQEVTDATTNELIHLEPGLWLNLPATTSPSTSPTVARLGTIPHGDALLAQGNFFTVDGGPQIGTADTTPFTLDPTTGARQNVTSAQYLAPFTSTSLPPGIPTGAIANPNILLTEAIQGQNIVNTVVLSVAANPIGGINGTPIAPPNAPNNVGAITNIPFVNANPNPNSFSAIFWIETVQNPDGSQRLQLQYTQTVIFDFDGLKWPHVSVATLVKH